MEIDLHIGSLYLIIGVLIGIAGVLYSYCDRISKERDKWYNEWKKAEESYSFQLKLTEQLKIKLIKQVLKR